MRLVEFKPANLSQKQVDELLRKHCGQILGIYKQTSKRLLCGSDGQPNNFIDTTPVGRPGLHNSPKFNNFLDNRLAKCGFKSLRGNSIFCSGNYSTAEGYGTVYTIYPFDGFAFTWNQHIDDILPRRFTQLLQKYGSNENIGIGMYDDNSIQGNGIRNQTNLFIDAAKSMTPQDFVKKMGFRNDDLTGALNSGHEISIHGKYLAMRNLVEI